MYNYKISLFEGDAWVGLEQWARPFNKQETLDESLDTGNIIVNQTKRDEDILPFVMVKIEIFVGESPVDIEYLLIADTEKVQRGFAPSWA